MTKRINTITVEKLREDYPALYGKVGQKDFTWRLIRMRMNGHQLKDLVEAALPKLEELARGGVELTVGRGKAQTVRSYEDVVLHLCGRGEHRHATGIADQVRATGLTRREVTPSVKKVTRSMSETALQYILTSWRSHRAKQGKETMKVKRRRMAA